MRKMIPVHGMDVRTKLNLSRAQVAREANMQPGIIAWIEEGRFIPYDSQLGKIADVYRRHGWTGSKEDLIEETEPNDELNILDERNTIC